MLITCPACGKQVSDTAPNCIHCNAPLNMENSNSDESKEKIEFESLSTSEQDALEREFRANNPDAQKKWDTIKNQRRTAAIIIISSIVITLLGIGITLYLMLGTDIFIKTTTNIHYSGNLKYEYTETTYSPICFVLLVGFFILPITIAEIIIKRFEKRIPTLMSEYVKSFSEWLKEKGYEYEPVQLFL